MLTQEQQDIVEAVMQQTEGIVSVNAVAGSGKTTLAGAIIDAVRPSNGFYTAFNRAIVQDSAEKFGHLVECKTIHALAYRNLKPKKQIKDISYDDIVEDITQKEKWIIVSAMNDFFLSAYLDVNRFLSDVDIRYDLRPLVVKYINLMLDGKINPTFNFMLKVLHYDLASGKDLHKDLLILDECQDSTNVAFEIFKLIQSPKKIVLGDRFQNIYGFMNTINVFDHLEGDTRMKLTKSFRCNPGIAEKVEYFGDKYLEAGFRFRGNENTKSDDTEVYLTRTNSWLIRTIVNMMNKGEKFRLIRDVNEIFNTPVSVLMASIGKPVYKKSLKFLEVEYEKLKREMGRKPRQYDFFNNLLNIYEDDIEITSSVKLLDSLRKEGINIFDVKKKVEQMETNDKITLATAHSYKGLESNTVYLMPDLNSAMSKALEEENTQQEKNLYYVAASRAKHKLNGAHYVEKYEPDWM